MSNTDEGRWLEGLDEEGEALAFEAAAAAEEITSLLYESPALYDPTYAAELEHDRELEGPSAEQERAWDEQYDGTSLGA